MEREENRPDKHVLMITLFSWIVGSVTMVTFRCEYSWLLFCWPMACLFWLILAALALSLMSKEIKITLDGQRCAFWEILLLPYQYHPLPHTQSSLSSALPVFPSPIADIPYLNKSQPIQS
jgi:hypothetical protein